MYIYKISQQYPDVALAEIETLVGKTTKLDDNLFVVDTINDDSKRLAFTKEIYKILSCKNTINEVLEHPIEDEYRFDAVGEETIPLADKLYDLHKKTVNLKNYAHRYVLFSFKKKYFTEEVWSNHDNGQERRAHQRVYNHPTSMHPLLAKAMVNLSGKKSFIDPFCGAGGILVEGAKLGFEVLGTDISEEMIERAQENLDELGYVVQLTVQDALVVESTYDAVITDLPYGKNSILGSIDLHDKFLEHAKEITTTLVIGSKQGTITDLHGWKEVYRFPIYVHKSLTREILVLKKYLLI